MGHVLGSHVGRVLEVLTEVQCEVDDVRVLDVVHHGVRLPPRLVLEVVEVGEVGGRMLPAVAERRWGSVREYGARQLNLAIVEKVNQIRRQRAKKL